MAAKRKRSPLRLYVWEDVLCDYTSGIAFALARSPDHARKLISKSMFGGGEDVVASELTAEPKVYAKPIGFHLYGGG